MTWAWHRILSLACVAFVLPIALLPQDKEKAEPPHGSSTKLRIEVTGGDQERPIENASVYVKYVQKHLLAKDKKVEMNVKTNHDGVVKLPELPRGRVMVQVLAEGWKPFGRYYELEEDQQTVKIRLEKPRRWY